MSATWQIVAMATGIFLVRWSGLAARNLRIPPRWEQGLRFVPVAMVAGLVTTSLAGRGEGRVEGLIAALIAAVVARLTGRMWACIASGLIVYAVVHRL